MHPQLNTNNNKVLILKELTNAMTNKAKGIGKRYPSKMLQKTDPGIMKD